MLLIEPPLECEDWLEARLGSPEFQEAFSDYCVRYQRTVLSLPQRQLDRIWARLVKGLEKCTVSGELLHVIVERELREENFEASSKAARLIFLCAVGQALKTLDMSIPEETDGLLDICRELVPAVLILAINDHYAITPASVGE